MAAPKTLDPRVIAKWQWETYASYHRNRINLLLHIVAVPMFMFGTLIVIAGFRPYKLSTIVIGFVAMAVSIIMQGRGHKLEEKASEPFDPPEQAYVRLFVENWITFPRFYLTGRWTSAFVESGKPASSNKPAAPGEPASPNAPAATSEQQKEQA